MRAALLLAALLLPVLSYAQLIPFSFRPVGAEYSASLDRLVMISGNPSRLHIYAPNTQTDTIVALPKVPLSLSVSPNGLFAAVGHDSQVSYVNLSTGIIDKSFSVAVSSPTVVLGAEWVYVLSATYQQNSVSINIATGAPSSSNYLSFNVTGPRLNTAVNAIYGTRDGTSPNDVEKIDVSTGPMTAQTDSIYHGDYSVCGPVFLSPSQSRIYTGCGTIFRASTDSSLDMHYVGNMPGVTNLKAFSESASTKRIAVVSSINQGGYYYYGPYDESLIYLYESDFRNQIGTFKMPSFQAGQNSFAAHGKWLFFNSTGATLYALEQADPSSGFLDDFRLQIINLSAPAPCDATFESITAQIIGAGSIGAVNVHAVAECIYSATSQTPWIDIVSGGYGSGAGVLKYIVRANAGVARQGTITLGNSTLTITQASAETPGVFTRLPYNVVSASYDKPLKKLILISAAPNELHIYDPETHADQKIPLSLAPLSLSVEPDGLFAAVGHDGWVSYINLQNATLQQMYSVLTDVGSILLAGNGWVYLFPAREWSDIYSMQLSTGNVTAIGAIYDGRVPRLYIDGNYMYVGGYDFSKWSISSGAASPAPGYLYGSTCGNLWLTEDGRRMITACGSVFRTSSVPSEDLQANGSFPNVTLVWAEEASIPHLTAVLARTDYNQPGASELRIYGDAFLQLNMSTGMRSFEVANSTYAGYGQFVFWNVEETKLILVEEADPASNLLSSYAVAIMSPTRRTSRQITSQ